MLPYDQSMTADVAPQPPRAKKDDTAKDADREPESEPMPAAKAKKPAKKTKPTTGGLFGD
jgi:hypothetical protein